GHEGTDGAKRSSPPLLLAHGWMDVGASFQRFVDFLSTSREVIALDWRGFGESKAAPGDSYWFYDYYADLDAVIDHISPDNTWQFSFTMRYTCPTRRPGLTNAPQLF